MTDFQLGIVIGGLTALVGIFLGYSNIFGKFIDYISRKLS